MLVARRKFGSEVCIHLAHRGTVWVAKEKKSNLSQDAKIRIRNRMHEYRS